MTLLKWLGPRLGSGSAGYIINEPNTQRLEEQAGCLLAHWQFKAESVSASVFGERGSLVVFGRC